MIDYNEFSEKDQICHSLIEGKVQNNDSIQFIDTLLNKLQNYSNNNGYDMVIDELFIKYLNIFKYYNIKPELTYYIKTLNKPEKITSQYHIAFICFADSKNIFNFKYHIRDQAYKLVGNKSISINGIDISNVISFHILKKFFYYFKYPKNRNNSYNMTSSKDNYYLNKIKFPESLDIYNIKFCSVSNEKEKNEIKSKYDEFKINQNSYFSINFWKTVNIYGIIDNHEIDVQDNPYLLNAAACLCYVNPMIKVKYDISKINFPEIFTLDLYPLLFDKLTITQLLEYKPFSNEVKNLCSFIYLLILEHKSINDLQRFVHKMNQKSYSILLQVYSKYVNQSVSNYDRNQIDIHNPNDFFTFIFLKLKMGNMFTREIIEKNNNLLYIKKCDRFNFSIKTVENYGYAKRMFFHSKSISYIYNYAAEKYKEDFLRFVKCSLKCLHGAKKTEAIALLSKYNSYDISMTLDFLFSLIDSGEYQNAQDLLNDIKLTKDVEAIIKNENNLEKIKTLLQKIKIENKIQIIKKFNLNELFDNNNKLNMYFNKEFPVIKFNVSRELLLNDSICYFLDSDLRNKSINITYNNEYASDEGGLSRDWFINVSKEIIKTEIFIPVPNGSSLTFNHAKEDLMLYHFVGQFIAAAFNNRRNINIKLASFIWKKMIGEEVGLDDLKEYDIDLYESMKWISENDPSLLEMTFVDSNDNELCKDGSRIDVTNDNKDVFIQLMIESKLVNENKELIDSITCGFREVIDFNSIIIFDAKSIQEIINGKDIIDVKDWMMNTVYDKEFMKKFNEFFGIISKWSQENLQKLLMFVTGSPIIPFGGFKNLEKNGGLFTIHFNKNEQTALPTSHTCFNKIEIPCYPSSKIFEEKLLMAIECDSFGFS